MRRISWQLAEKIMGCRLDRRKRYRYVGRKHRDFWGCLVVVDSGYTGSCSGCYESGECGGMEHWYEWDEKAKCRKGAGCDECGYTGKRVHHFAAPALSLEFERELARESA